MENQTQTDKTTEIHKNLKKLLESGIPVSQAWFLKGVNNSDGTPEEMFSTTSNHPSRNVTMYWTPGGLICEHKDKHFVVPLANVKFANFK